MARISIDLPETFPFFIKIPVRITDLNYGGHVGNDSILSIIHEARMSFLFWNNYTEKDLAGASLIMGDVSIVFKNELFYGDVVIASGCHSRSVSKVQLSLLYYKLEKETGGRVKKSLYQSLKQEWFVMITNNRKDRPLFLTKQRKNYNRQHG